MVARIVVVLALLVLGGLARADSPKLAKARQAIEGVQYDEAEKLLVEALRDGGNSPADVAEIYRLSADVAVVLERRDLAEQYYRRWLALDPKAALSSDTPPKMREPFVKAQAHMNAHGRLAAKIARTAAGIEIVVETDPLGMAVAASILRSPGTDGGVRTPLDADRRARLPAQGTTVAVVDEHGNRLVELAVPAGEVVVRDPVKPPPPPPRELPFYRRPGPWLTASGVALLGGFVTGFLADEAHADVGNIVATSSEHTLADFNRARDRRDRYALAANLCYGTFGAALVGAIVVRILRPKARVTATVAPGAVGVALRF